MQITTTFTESLESPPESWGDAECISWNVLLTRDNVVRMETAFFTGTGWKTTPTAKDVLDLLVMEATGIEGTRSFEEWAADCGWDDDSRKAFAMYELCIEQTNKLRGLLGDSFDTVVFSDPEGWEVSEDGATVTV